MNRASVEEMTAILVETNRKIAGMGLFPAHLEIARASERMMRVALKATWSEWKAP